MTHKVTTQNIIQEKQALLWGLCSELRDELGDTTYTQLVSLTRAEICKDFTDHN